MVRITARQGVRWLCLLTAGLVSLLFSIHASASQHETTVTILGPPDYPPYSYQGEQGPKGIYPDLFREISEQLGDYRIEIELLPWKRALKLVEVGHYIAVYPPYHWPKERPWMTGYSEPLLQEPVAVFCRRDVLDHARPNWPDDYFGLRIGVDLGNLAPGPRFFEAVKAKKITHKKSTLDMIVPHLLANSFDCAVQDENVIHYYFNRHAAARQLGMPFDSYARKGAPIADNWSYLGFGSDPQGLFPYQADFMATLNTAIRHLQASGRIEEIRTSRRVSSLD